MRERERKGEERGEGERGGGGGRGEGKRKELREGERKEEINTFMAVNIHPLFD